MRSNRSRFLVIPVIALSVTLGLSACGSSTAKDSGAGSEVAAVDSAAGGTDVMAPETGAPAPESLPAESVAAAPADSAAMAPADSAAMAPADSAAMAPADGAKDIVDTAVGAGNFTTLAKLLGDAGLVETLKGPGPFTVFAPTDEAFAAVPKDVLDGLAADKTKLAAVLTYHVVAGKVMAADIKPGDVPTVNGATVKLSAADGKVMVNDATVTTADIVASNGVIHVIDKVILPPA
jgi:uncharacterized surface protein with fasciclin (FAS1) repeats